MEEEDVYDLEDLEEPEPEVGRQPREAIVLPDEPLFAALLRREVERQWPGDAVMADLMQHVAAPLSDTLGHVAAKGGAFAREREAQGTGDERYSRDQSQRAHLVNGLLPTLHVARALQQWGAPQLRAYDDTARRLFIAGHILHDYLKLPGVEQQLEGAGFDYQRAVGPAQMPLLEEILRAWCRELGLDRFLEPAGGAEAYLHDLLYIACNTQTRWGTLRNLSLLPRLRLPAVQRDLAEQLSRLADLLAYVARTPVAACAHPGIHRELTTLSDGLARLAYHHVSEIRGVMTNLIHNAALKALASPQRVPLLFAPSGVVYLEHKKAPAPPSVQVVAEETVQVVRETARHALQLTPRGMQRDGKGIKCAGYYPLCFAPAELVVLGARAIFRLIREGKASSASKRFAKMRGQRWLDASADLDLPDDLRVDQLAEWCALAEQQVREQLPGFDTASFLLQHFGLQDLGETFRAVPRDNRAGGVPYHWYLAAGNYLKRHPGLDPTAWQERIEGAARALAAALPPVDRPLPVAEQTWQELRDYVARVLTVGAGTAGAVSAFADELRRYTAAKKKGQGRTPVCSLCSSPYRVDKQEEAGVLFAPQVYSNKRPLHSTDARRDICSVCGLELMLRQVLMNDSGFSGGRFEGRRLRYLYFYPTYFFTPETLAVLRRAYAGLRNLPYTELRRQLVGRDGSVNLAPGTLQRLEPLLLAPEGETPTQDRFLRLHMPEEQACSFSFVGLPPGRDAKDAEAWVYPALLALLLPLCLDVKVVASESSVPLLLEADDIPETVFLDAPHAAVQYLTRGRTRVHTDDLLPTLQRLMAGYLIHIDANSSMGRQGYDYRWQDLPALARALATSPLYAFHYLKKGQRQRAGEAAPAAKAREYLAYVQFLDGGEAMSHAQELTRLYRQFYRARRYNSNSVLRPISIAARAVLDADPRLFDREGLIEAVVGELRSFAERAQREGLAYLPRGSTHAQRDEAMRAFARYFVETLFYGVFRGDRSALRGRQLNLLKGACEVIYQDESARDRAEREALALDGATDD